MNEAAKAKWEPVNEVLDLPGAFIHPDDSSTPVRVFVYSESGRLCIAWDNIAVEVDMPPDTLHLCRRVEAIKNE